jgi:hypothetical protein
MSLKVPPNNPTNDASSETFQSLASCAPGLRLAYYQMEDLNKTYLHNNMLRQLVDCHLLLVHP